jgi:hypothetical protein
MRLDPDHLRLMTLARQFPAPAAVAGPSGVADLLGRVGPIQSQAPRAPFVGLAARRPGVSYTTGGGGRAGGGRRAGRRPAPPCPADLEAAVADLGRALGTSVDGVTVR